MLVFFAFIEALAIFIKLNEITNHDFSGNLKVFRILGSKGNKYFNFYLQDIV